MAAPVPLRPDFDAPRLRALARRLRDPDQTRRLMALAAIYEGASRSEAARIGCVTLQIVRDWVLRFNARGPQGLVTGRAPGSRPRSEAEVSAFKKSSPPVWRRSPRRQAANRSSSGSVTRPESG